MGPLGVRRDIALYALLVEFCTAKRAGRGGGRAVLRAKLSRCAGQPRGVARADRGSAVKTGLSCAAPGLGRSWARWFRRASNGIPVRTESVAPPQPAPVSSDRTGSGIGVLPSAGVCLGEGEAVAGQGNGHWSVAVGQGNGHWSAAVGQGNGHWGREPGIGAGKLPAPIRRSLPQCEPAPCADGYGIHRGAGPAAGGYTARPLCGWRGRWPRRRSDDEEPRVRCVARSHPRKSAASQGPGPSGCPRGASGADPSTPPVRVRSSSSRSGCG